MALKTIESFSLKIAGAREIPVGAVVQGDRSLDKTLEKRTGTASARVPKLFPGLMGGKVFTPVEELSTFSEQRLPVHQIRLLA